MSARTQSRHGSIGRRGASCIHEALECRRLLAAGGLWEVRGDLDPANPSDLIRIEISPDDPTRLQAVVNGEVVGSRSRGRRVAIRVLAGDGDDRVAVDLGQATGRVRVLAGAGNDHVVVAGAAGDLLGGDGDDTLIGGSASDRLDGGAGDNHLEGGTGNDRLIGGVGNDTMAGGAGRDVLNAGGGDDQMFGADGNDSLLGGDGADTLTGGGGADVCNPGSGRDKVYSGGRPDRLVRGRRATPAATADVVLADTGDAAFSGFADPGALNQWLIDAAVRRWQNLFGQPYQPVYQGWMPVFFDAGNEVAAFTPVASDMAAAAPGGVTSGTNTQVRGVDEADLVETDGRYLYVASGTKLLIVRADPADQMAVVSERDLGASVRGIYLSRQRVTVVSEGYGGWYHGGDVFPAMDAARMAMMPAEVNVTFTTYDVSDATNPQVTEQTEIDGSYVESRSIDGRVYAVVRNGLELPPPEPVTVDGEEMYESEEAYRARLLSQGVAAELPEFTATAGSATRTGTIVSATDLYVSGEDEASPELTSLVLIDPAAGEVGVDDSATVVGPAGGLFATAGSMYVTGWAWDEDTGTQRTNVARFRLGADSVALEAVGTVAGSVLNQFSMGEHDGRLQIATTSFDGVGTSSNVYVMGVEGDRLEPVGAVTGIAPGERIYSARFTGDKGYLVTFRQVDPLFTLDLSDPFAPRVVGELKVPGFSSYLHEIGDRHLLGLGRAGDEMGQTGGLQLSLFDVGNTAEPKLVTSYAFSGNRWSNGSEAEYDHHAIQYFEDLQLVALPVRDYDWERGADTNGISLVKVDPTAGTMEQVGFIAQTDAQRTVRIDSTLFAVGSGKITAVDAADPSHVVGSVDLPSPTWPAWPIDGLGTGTVIVD